MFLNWGRCCPQGLFLIFRGGQAPWGHWCRPFLITCKACLRARVCTCVGRGRWWWCGNGFFLLFFVLKLPTFVGGSTENGMLCVVLAETCYICAFWVYTSDSSKPALSCTHLRGTANELRFKKKCLNPLSLQTNARPKMQEQFSSLARIAETTHVCCHEFDFPFGFT